MGLLASAPFRAALGAGLLVGLVSALVLHGRSSAVKVPPPVPFPPPVPGEPVERRPPNGAGQTPAFAGQTRAPYQPLGVTFDVRVVARGLVHPWAVAFLPGGDMVVTERPGRLRIVAADGTVSAPAAGVPKVLAEDQGGLLDVAVSPHFADDGLVFFTFAEPREGGSGTALGRGRLVMPAGNHNGPPRLEGVTILWRMTPTFDSTKHFGSRVVFGTDGNLFVTTGERSDLGGRRQAQRLDGTLGKVVRVTPEGAPPSDNPFAGTAGARPEIWSIGHRNLQGAALHPVTRELWTVEHGARGGDEINVVRGGKDYGWPTITYGVEYSGKAIGDGLTQKAGMEQPVYYWDPVIAPSGMAFYDGNVFPKWKGSLFVGALAGQHLARLSLEGEKVVGEERLLVERRKRIRDVRTGPRGTVFLLTDEDDGELWELVPPSATP